MALDQYREKSTEAGVALTDISVASLTTAQAAGTAAVITADATRNVVAVISPTDGRLFIASAAGDGFYWPIYADIPRIISGPGASGALFFTGGAQGAKFRAARG